MIYQLEKIQNSSVEYDIIQSTHFLICLIWCSGFVPTSQKIEHFGILVLKLRIKTYKVRAQLKTIYNISLRIFFSSHEIQKYNVVCLRCRVGYTANIRFLYFKFASWFCLSSKFKNSFKAIYVQN